MSRYFQTLFAVSTVALCASLLPAATPRELLHQPTPGINFAGPADWATELPFVDAFKLSRAWISQREGGRWGSGPKLDLDEHGYVKSIATGTFVETPVLNIEGGHYPSGVYTLLFDGQGELEVAGAGKIVNREPGRYQVEVDANKGAVWIRIRKTDPDDYVRDIHFIMPGYEKSFRTNPWRPEFLEKWKFVKSFRSMDWQHTNNSTIALATDFPSLDDASWTKHGLPIEIICDFANRSGIEPWFCVPHLANDEAVTHMAKTIQRHLDPERTFLIEYSNEVWNGQFAQSRYAGEQGQKLGLADKPWEAAWKFTGKRSIEIFEIFASVFGSTDRMVRVLPSQSANPYVGKQVIESALAAGQADALAIAPYISMNIKGDQADQYVALGVDGILAKAFDESLPKTLEHIRQNAELARQHSLGLIAYEAGQHFVGIQGGENNQKLEAILHRVNAHQRMEPLYRQYLDAWSASGGGLICLFSSTSRWSKWGSWGLMQYADDHPSDYAKMRSFQQWATRTR